MPLDCMSKRVASLDAGLDVKLMGLMVSWFSSMYLVALASEQGLCYTNTCAKAEGNAPQICLLRGQVVSLKYKVHAQMHRSCII